MNHVTPRRWCSLRIQPKIALSGLMNIYAGCWPIKEEVSIERFGIGSINTSLFECRHHCLLHPVANYQLQGRIDTSKGAFLQYVLRIIS